MSTKLSWRPILLKLNFLQQPYFHDPVDGSISHRELDIYKHTCHFYSAYFTRPMTHPLALAEQMNTHTAVKKQLYHETWWVSPSVSVDMLSKTLGITTRREYCYLADLWQTFDSKVCFDFYIGTTTHFLLCAPGVSISQYSKSIGPGVGSGMTIGEISISLLLNDVFCYKDGKPLQVIDATELQRREGLRQNDLASDFLRVQGEQMEDMLYDELS